jgi:hypothetical protein
VVLALPAHKAPAVTILEGEHAVAVNLLFIDPVVAVDRSAYKGGLREQTEDAGAGWGINF